MTWEIRQGDALDRLREMPDESVQCTISSPPYWGLRDYGVDGQLGLEETPEQFVAGMVGVFAEVRRVLRGDGTLWLNIGDTYARFAGTRNGNFGRSAQGVGIPDGYDTRKPPPGLKEKDLVGIPWMLAFALRADGWYLRRDIIWNKPNPMPESVQDRPTSAHEYLFLFAKGQRKSRVVAFADLHGEPVHLGQHVGSHDPNAWADEFGVRLATAILDAPKIKQHLSLPPLDAEVWKERPGDHDGFGVAGLPVEHRAAVLAARLLSTHGTAKEFLGEIDRLGVALAERDKLLVGGGAAVFALPPGVNRYGKTAIAIHDAGEIGEIDFAAHTVKCSRPSGCSYFYDAEAIREPGTWAGQNRADRGPRESQMPGAPAHAGLRSEKQRGHGRRHDGFNERWDAMSKELQQALGRNKRSVWTIATRPYPDAHFATFPPDLVEPCILAGSPPKCCGECGAPWRRVLSRQSVGDWNPRDAADGRVAKKATEFSGTNYRKHYMPPETTGWEPTCDHADDSGRSLVLDPFAGAATTGLVATQHRRDFIGIELNPEYVELGEQRIRRWEANPAGHLKGDAAPLDGQVSIEEILAEAGAA